MTGRVICVESLFGADGITQTMMFVGLGWVALCVVVGMCIKRIPEGGAAVVERFGKYHRTAGKGMTFVVPFVDRIPTVTDMREQNIRMKPHSVTTLDDVMLEVPLIIRCRIVDARAARYEVDDLAMEIRNSVREDLGEMVEDMMFDEVLASGPGVAERLTEGLRRRSARWGIEVHAVEIEEMMTSGRM